MNDKRPSPTPIEIDVSQMPTSVAGPLQTIQRRHYYIQQALFYDLHGPNTGSHRSSYVDDPQFLQWCDANGVDIDLWCLIGDLFSDFQDLRYLTQTPYHNAGGPGSGLLTEVSWGAGLRDLGAVVGYLVSVNPLDDTYSTVSIFGDWGPEDSLLHRWFNDWMNIDDECAEPNQRRIKEGRLFKNVYTLPSSSTALLVDWNNDTDSISDDPREILGGSIGWATVVPVTSNGFIIGLLTIGFPTFEAAREAAAPLFYVANTCLSPMMAPHSHVMSSRVVLAAVQKAFTPTVQRQAKAISDSVKSINEQLFTISAQVSEPDTQFDAIRRHLEAIRSNANLPNRLLASLLPAAAEYYLPDSDHDPECTALELAAHCKTAQNNIVNSADLDFGDLAELLLVDVSGLANEITLPMPVATAYLVLEELLLNAYQAVHRAISDQDSANNDYPTLLNMFRNTRGEDPRIAVTLTETSNSVTLSVADNGSGMTEAVVERALFFGFSDLSSGSGVGLTVVHQNVQHYGGTIFINTNHKGGTIVEMAFPTR
jgi:hypothetical protein